MAIVGYGLEAVNGSEAVQMLMVGLLLFVLPIIAAWLAVKIENIKDMIL